MRKIVNSTYVTLDGVIEAPQNWPSTEGDGDRAYAMQRDLLFACDTVLMGRRTYEGFAPVWASRCGDEYSDRINAMEKVVVSSTLTDPEWANTRVIADPVPELRRLKQEPGLDIVQYGFGQLSYALMENELLDELRLWIHPFFVGSGGPADLLYRDSRGATLRLTDTTVLASGIVVLTYAFAYPS